MTHSKRGMSMRGVGWQWSWRRRLRLAGHSDEADALFFHTVKVRATAGLYQTFLDAGAGVGHAVEAGLRAGPKCLSRPIAKFCLIWEACFRAGIKRLAGGRSSQPDNRVSDAITVRERGYPCA